MEENNKPIENGTEPEVNNDKNGKPKKSWKQELKEWVFALGFALVVVFLLTNFLFRIIRVDGSSMETTLHNGERLFVNVAEVKFSEIVPRGSIVICHYPNRGMTYFVKRVVAIPGDKVYRKDGITHVVYEEDGAEVDEALEVGFRYYYPSPDYEPYTLGEDEYFCVGDNRGNSHDSRDWKDNDSENDVGPITKKMIIGRVREVIWPLNAIRAAE